ENTMLRRICFGGTIHMRLVGMPTARAWRVGLAQAICCELDGLNDLTVAGATADITGDCFHDIMARRCIVVLEQRMRRENHSWCAVTALQTVGFAERVLH